MCVVGGGAWCTEERDRDREIDFDLSKDMRVKVVSLGWGANSSVAAFKTAAMLALANIGKSVSESVSKRA
jgi:hypothetical protein